VKRRRREATVYADDVQRDSESDRVLLALQGMTANVQALSRISHDAPMGCVEYGRFSS
jgi:hypothetical protein